MVFSAHDTLLIKTENAEFRFEASELLKRKEVEKIVLSNDPSKNNQPNQYFAIAVDQLLKELKISPQSSLYLKATDGMTVVIDSERFLKPQTQARAFLAIKPIEGNWHQLKSGQSAGPYFLIWKNANLNEVGPEEWPYSVNKIEIKASVAEIYPGLLPQKNHMNYKVLYQGYKVFIKNCLPCHQLNKQGISDFGPDLNYPMSPVEYFKPEALVKYIRDPRSVRVWNQSRMPGFSEAEISKQQMKDLISYLSSISKSK